MLVKTPTVVRRGVARFTVVIWLPLSGGCVRSACAVCGESGWNLEFSSVDLVQAGSDTGEADTATSVVSSERRIWGASAGDVVLYAPDTGRARIVLRNATLQLEHVGDGSP